MHWETAVDDSKAVLVVKLLAPIALVLRNGRNAIGRSTLCEQLPVQMPQYTVMMYMPTLAAVLRFWNRYQLPADLQNDCETTNATFWFESCN